MGELYITEKAKGFKHKAEQEHANQLSSAGLFEAIQDLSRLVVHFSAPGTILAPGTRLRFLEENRDLLTVIQGTARIGEVDAAGSAELRARLTAHPELGHMIAATTISGPDWSGAYEATPCPPTKK